MKTTILAGLLALAGGIAAVVPTTTPAQAASLTIELGDSGHSRYDGYTRYPRWRTDRGLHRGWYNGERRYGMRRAYRECEVTTNRYWRNGRVIVERERNCY